MKVFSRSRVGLRKARGQYAPAGLITTCSVHHGGEVGAPRSSFLLGARTWRSWQDFHQFDAAHGWIDIGYNVGVDGLGRLYAGRPVGCLPAAVLGHNSNSFGLVFMQDGDRFGLTWLQRRTLRRLFEQGCPELNIPPLRTLDVRGHREFSGHASNRCPGDKIMRHLKWRRGVYR